MIFIAATKIVYQNVINPMRTLVRFALKSRRYTVEIDR